jgi:hypothetical protein
MDAGRCIASSQTYSHCANPSLGLSSAFLVLPCHIQDLGITEGHYLFRRWIYSEIGDTSPDTVISATIPDLPLYAEDLLLTIRHEVFHR